MSELHEAAKTGFSAGAGKYASGRPDYPSEIAGWLNAALRLGPGRTAVDLGAGTGKFTPRLLATGARVIAVEPVAEMRARIAEAAPGAEIRPATPPRCRSPTARPPLSSARRRSTGSPPPPRSLRCAGR